MSEGLIVQTNGPYLRIVLPDFESNWAAVWDSIDFELEEGSCAPRWSPLLPRRRMPRGRLGAGHATGATRRGDGRRAESRRP
jgi:hypothetical protein